MSSKIPTFHAEDILPCQNELGEGIVWDAKTQLLHWLDVLHSELHTLDIKTKNYSVDSYPESRYLSFFAPRATAPGFVGTLQGALVTLPAATAPSSTAVPASRNVRKSETLLSGPLDKALLETNAIRFNDGGVDPEGRVWYGSMGQDEDAPTKVGELWKFDPVRKEETKMLEGVGVSNGLGWSPDGLTAYYIDSSKDVISAYTYTPTGELVDKRTLIGTPPPLDNTRPTEGVWDGLCVDGVGNVWAGRWRDERVIAVSPEGKILVQVTVKGAKSPTIPCFGGPNLDQLYIATAASHLGGTGDSTKYPKSGDLFSLDVGPGSEIRSVLGEGWKGAERHRADV